MMSAYPGFLHNSDYHAENLRQTQHPNGCRRQASLPQPARCDGGLKPALVVSHPKADWELTTSKGAVQEKTPY